jgi:hypothetical protein
MRKSIEGIEKYFLKNTRMLFVLDAGGAALTSFLLYCVLRPLESFFGMPADVLSVLSVVGLAFFLFSLMCAVSIKSSWHFPLRIIAILNVVYCLATIYCVVIHFDVLSLYGLAYFAGEVGIILYLVYMEWVTSNLLKIIQG